MKEKNMKATQVGIEVSSNGGIHEKAGKKPHGKQERLTARRERFQQIGEAANIGSHFRDRSYVERRQQRTSDRKTSKLKKH